MNQQQKKETKKLPSFYIALCCCVLAIGIAGYFTERHNSDSSSMLSNEIADNSGSEVFSDSTDKFTSSALNVSEDETQEASSANVEESSEVVSDTETAINTDSATDPSEGPVVWKGSPSSLEKQFRFRQSFQSALPISGSLCGPRCVTVNWKDRFRCSNRGSSVPFLQSNGTGSSRIS